MRAPESRRKVGGRAIGLAVASAVSVVLCGNAARALTWDANGSSPTLPADGGGTWDLSHADWSTGSADQIWPNNSTAATFGDNNGTAGVVNLSVPITASELVFNLPGSGNYNLSGASLDLTAGIIQINSTNPTIACDLLGSAGLSVSGTGSVTLTGTNGYSGGTTVLSGTLIVDSGAAITFGTVAVDSSAVLIVGASTSFSGNIINSGTFNVAAGQTVSLQSTSYTFNQAAGALNINGTLVVPGTFNDNGGTINGTVTMNGSNPTLNFGANASSGTFLLAPSSSFAEIGSANIPAGVIVHFQPSVSSELEGLISPLTNNGTLTMTSASGDDQGLETPFVNNNSFTVSATGTPSSVATLEVFTNNVAGSASFNTSASVSGNIINSGTFNVAAGQTVSLQSTSYTFNQAAGALNINGTLVVPGTFNDNGGTINGTVTMNGSNPTLNFGANASSGTFLLAPSSSFAEIGSANIPAGVIVHFQPSVSSELEGLISPLTNNGTLTMTSASGDDQGLETPFVNNNSFTVSATGTPSSVATLEVFTNNVAGSASFNTSASVSGNIINSGTFNVAAGQTVSLQSTSYTFNQAAGALNINGTLVVPGTFNDNGGTINGTVTMNGSNPTLNFGANASSGTFLLAPSSSFAEIGSANIPAGVIVHFQPSVSSELEGLISPLTNNGTLTMTSASGDDQGLETPFVNNNSFTVSATGTPSSVATLEVFTNNVAGSASFNTSASVSGNIINSGTFNVAAGQTVSLQSTSYTFNQAAGALNINGTLVVPGTFNDNGGTINGTVTMNGSNPTLNFGANASSGTFLLAPSSSFAEIGSANIPAGVIVHFQPSVSSELEGLISPLTNNGTLTMTSASGDDQGLETPFVNNNSFTVSATGTPSSVATLEVFTNNVAGSASFNTSASVSGNIINSGTFNVAAGQTVSLQSTSYTFNQAAGALNINGTLVVPGTFNDNGGTINGTVTMNGSNPTLNFGANASSGTFLLAPSSSFAEIGSANIPAGVIVHFQPSVSSELEGLISPLTNNGTLTMTSASGDDQGLETQLVNNGTFEVLATGTPSQAASLETFTNNTAGTAILNTSVTINGNLVNSGTLNINAGTLQLFSAGNVFNQSAGTTNIADYSQVSLPNSGQFIIVGGTIALAPSAVSPGVLNIVSLLWPNPSIAMNPATDLGFISTLSYFAGQLPGQLNLGGGERVFNIADPNATLTVTAEITNGALDKTGPGTLVLNGIEQLTGTLNADGGTVTIGPNATFPNNIPINVSSGTTLNVLASIPNDVITNNGTVNFPAQSTAGIHLIAISGLSLTIGQHSNVANPAIHANRTLLQPGSLTFGGGMNNWQGLLDLSGNDMDVPGGSLANITNQVKQGYNNGTWTGIGGITSSAAAGDTKHLTALGVIQNNQSGTAIYGSGMNQALFDGIAPGASDVLVKYTYYGDANLDGHVDGSDYSRIDAAYLADKTNPTALTGWYNGDFNYDGVINGSDYTLIDNAFNSQGSQSLAEIADPAASATDQIAGSASVPEPAACLLSTLAAIGLLSRRASRSARMLP